jgi:hypothetical protein
LVSRDIAKRTMQLLIAAPPAGRGTTSAADFVRLSMQKRPSRDPINPAAVDARSIDRDAPLRLADAAALAYPFGGMTASGLRKEAARGDLAI